MIEENDELFRARFMNFPFNGLHRFPSGGVDAVRATTAETIGAPREKTTKYILQLGWICNSHATPIRHYTRMQMKITIYSQSFCAGCFLLFGGEFNGENKFDIQLKVILGAFCVNQIQKSFHTFPAFFFGRSNRGARRQSSRSEYKSATKTEQKSNFNRELSRDGKWKRKWCVCVCQNEIESLGERERRAAQFYLFR